MPYIIPIEIIPINENGIPNATHNESLNERKNPKIISTNRSPIIRFLLKVSIL